MSVAPLAYRWSPSEFLRAWGAGAFDHRVELVEGEVWPVVIGTWHGFTVARVLRMIHSPGVNVSTATLPTGDSLPDPDGWVVRAGADPVGTVGGRLEVWNPSDVLLVVEVSDETVLADLQTKAKLYARTGYPVYWVVTRDTIYEHITPGPGGYHTRNEYRPGERIPVSYADTDLSVDELLGPA